MTDLSEALRTSPATVRRDITEMDEKGLVERTWGGVRLVGDLDDPFQEALASHGKGKQAIGEAAAALIPDGATVILDVGTTAYYVAMALEAEGVTVLTASLPTFELLRGMKNIDLISSAANGRRATSVAPGRRSLTRWSANMPSSRSSGAPELPTTGACATTRNRRAS